MRIDLGLILAILVECILFIYYADTLFYRKRVQLQCYITIAIGYTLYLFICTFGVVAANISSFIALNFLCFIFCYHVNYKNAFFQSVLLTGLSIAGEGIVIFIPSMGIDTNAFSKASSWQSMMVTIVGKLIYLTSIMVISRFFNKKANYGDVPSLSLTAIPIFTVVCIVLLVRANNNSNYIAAACITLVAINLVVFIINQGSLRKEAENIALREQVAKENIDYEEYRLLKEKHEQSRIFHHDFKEHMNTLCALIGENNEDAKAYIHSISQEESDMQLIEYSDNKILNILLSKKKTECHEKGIVFLIDPVCAKLNFISDIDTVTLFSNLINNAIESSLQSVEKKIFLSISTINKTFVVIKLENTSDKKPIVINGHLRTHKDNDKFHGIGMNSIHRILKNYNGKLDWDYDPNEKMFRTTAILNNL